MVGGDGRRAERGAPPGENISERLLQRDLRRPPGCLLELTKVPDEGGNLTGPDFAPILLHPRRHAREREKFCEQVVQRDSVPGTHVVHLSRHAALEKIRVGTDDVADIQIVTEQVEVPHAEHGW